MNHTTLLRGCAALALAFALVGCDEQETGPVVRIEPGAAVLENALVALRLDARGNAVSLVQKADGRELVKASAPFVSITDAKGKVHPGTNLLARAEGGLLTFATDLGEIDLKPTRFDGGWRFEVTRCTAKDFRELRLGRIDPVCLKWRGTMSNAYSDDRSFVCTRIYNMGGSFYSHAGSVCCRVFPKSLAPVGTRFGLAAGPRAAAIPSLRAMTLDAGVPHSDKGGAWALGAEDCRRSYWMAWGVGPFTVDDEIEQCRRGGFGTLHFDRFFKCYGSYELSKGPNGESGMERLRKMIAQAHAAGLHCDFHSLTACVAHKDPIATPECSDGLMTTAVYTLAEDLDAATNTSALVVAEKPIAGHEFTTTAWGNANVFKVGTELMTYSGHSAAAPWTFTGLKRGAFGTTVKPHAKGERVEYLRNSFSCFQIDADSELARREFELQGRLFGAGFDNYYMDGADCIGDRRKTDIFVRGLYEAALANGKAPLYEDSQWTPAAWWFHSRIGAHDHVNWGSKRSLDRRFEKVVDLARNAEFIEPELGWWTTMQSLYAGGIPYRLDEHEYFGRKCAAYDTAMSVLPDLYYSARYMVARNIHWYLTAIGWYERFRVARAFNDETLAKFRVMRDEYRLRQDADGVWKVRPLDFHHHRVTGPDARKWTVTSRDSREATIRIEALLTCKPWDSPEATTLLDPATAATFKTAAAKGVTVTCAAAQDEAHGAVVTMKATNAGATPRGAWSRVARVWPKPPVGQPPVYGDCSKSRGFGLWVKGDGSGALLNVQLKGPGKNLESGAKSEHYLRLDFTGWRYVEFNRYERDSGQAFDYFWPYVDPASSLDYALERSGVTRVEAVNLYLNEIPAGGKTEIAVSAVKVLPERKGIKYSDLAVTLNGTRHACPFALAPQEFAELEGGYWTHFNASGDELERAKASVVELVAGANQLAFEGSGGKDVNVRAEVNILALGRPSPALKPIASLPAASRKALAYEAVKPATWAPAKGYDAIPDLVTRPGEKASVSFEVYGPTAPFALTVGGETRRFGHALASNEYLVCRDGRNWQLKRRGEKPCIVAEGKIEPFKAFTGRQTVAMSCDEPKKAYVNLILAKHYGEK